jgi:nickel superoxide dismutase
MPGDNNLSWPDRRGASSEAAPDEQPVAWQQGGLHRALGDRDSPERPVHDPSPLCIRSKLYCQIPNPIIGRKPFWREKETMSLLARALAPKATAFAHCDLPCGVYDPAQARIEAESVKAICEKYQQNSDAEFRARAIDIKEQRSDLVKHHLWVLWTDYFKPPHFEKYPQLHQLFNDATKLAGAGGTKASTDPATADALLAKIEDISKIFWETKQA